MSPTNVKDLVDLANFIKEQPELVNAIINDQDDLFIYGRIRSEMINVKLKDWGIIKEQHSFRAPESIPIKLNGAVYGHPIKEDGKRVVTSAILEVDGRTITTESGTIYELVGEPSDKYLKYLEENSIKMDSDNPVTMV